MGLDVPATLAMLFQQTINGGYTVLAQAALDSISPELFALIRDSGASCVLMTVAYSRSKRFWPEREHIPLLMMCGACGVWGGQLLGAIAIKELGGVLFSVMQPAQPVQLLCLYPAPSSPLRWKLTPVACGS